MPNLVPEFEFGTDLILDDFGPATRAQAAGTRDRRWKSHR